jgi:hypothetical protein
MMKLVLASTIVMISFPALAAPPSDEDLLSAVTSGHDLSTFGGLYCEGKKPDAIPMCRDLPEGLLKDLSGARKSGLSRIQIPKNDMGYNKSYMGYNLGFGLGVLERLTTGKRNFAIGVCAGDWITDESDITCLGGGCCQGTAP